jgi:hypothetical protein
MTYEISIAAQTQAAGAEPMFVVSVVPPGELSAPTAKIKQDDLQAILEEILPGSSTSAVREHLNRAYGPDGDRIEIPSLSEAQVKMLRGLQQTAARI